MTLGEFPLGFDDKLNNEIPEPDNDISPETVDDEGEDAPERIPDDMAAFKKVFGDTMYFINELVSGYEYYPEIYSMIAEGSTKISVRRRYLLKAIDEKWISAVEESLVALDNLIRNPSRFIEETDKILPIEMSKNITSRSIKHLAQHTDLINRIEGDMVIPSKLLNVFQDETIFTYENKFVNTLINKLFLFVNKRYTTAKKHGKDEKSTSVSFSSEFLNGKIKGRFNFGIEISEPPESGVKLNNYTYTTDLWRRVKHLNSVVTAYISSEFCKAMGQNFIRPPVMHTNSINKNRDLRQCLALYEFIESYENVGYDLIIEETAEDLDDEYVKELYSMLAIQYLVFRSKTGGIADENRTLGTSRTETPLSPKFDTEFIPYKSDDYNVYDSRYHKLVPVSKLGERRKLSKNELDMREAIDVALAVEEIAEKERSAAEKAARAAEKAVRAAEKAAHLAAEEKARRLAAEEATRAEEEAKRLAAEEATRIAAEKARLDAEKAALKEAERKAAEEEKARVMTEEAARAAAEEAARAEEEAKRLASEETARAAAAEAARRMAEEEAEKAAEATARIAQKRAKRKITAKAVNKEAENKTVSDTRKQEAALTKNMGRKRKKQVKKLMNTEQTELNSKIKSKANSKIKAKQDGNKR